MFRRVGFRHVVLLMDENDLGETRRRIRMGEITRQDINMYSTVPILHLSILVI
jgi:hypothetical protein